MRRPVVAPVAVTLLLFAGQLSAQAEPVEQDFFRPDVSPDGSTLTFELHSDIWTAPVSGGEATRLTDGMDRYAVPTFSPDGGRIAAIATDPDVRTHSVRLIDVESGSTRMLYTSQQRIRGTLDWAPDGASLIVSVGLQHRLTRIPVRGGEPSELGHSGMHPRYAPDGRFLAYQMEENQDLWIVELTSGEKRRLATDIAVKSSFDWSPDGRRIVYESLDRESLDLWVVDARGGKATPLTDDIAIEQGPRWHPSNGRIYFTHRRQIFSIRADGTRMERVPVYGVRPALEPVPEVAVTEVDVLDLVTGQLSRGRTLLLRGGRISRIAERGEAIPGDVRRIDGEGLTAIPGLIDMHIHYEPWMGPFFLRHGVTRAVDLGSGRGLDRILALGQEISAGRARGPLLFQSGSVFNGSGTAGPPGLGGIQSDDPGVIRRALRWHIGEGIDIVKIGSENTPATLEAILETAHREDLRVTGHIALVPAQEAVAMGQDGIEHPRGLGWGTIPPRHRPSPVPRGLSGMLRESSAWLGQDEAMASKLVEQMVDAGVVWDPTLNIWRLLGDPRGQARDQEFEELPPWVKQEWQHGRESGFLGSWIESDFRAFAAPLPRMRAMVGRFHRAGGVVTAGSDGGIPGLSLIQELDQLRRAGLSPLASLQAATIDAARSLNASRGFGTIEEGKVADIVLLDGNPVEDWSALRRIRLVIQAGRIVQREP